MTGFTTAALVYAPDIPAPELQQLLLQMGSIGVETETVDRVTFDGIDGGSVERRLAIPYLAGMDAVEVRDAGLSLAGEQLAFLEPAPVKTLSSAEG
ncbi:MAG: hypothetical protein PVH47_04000, partial [Thiohalocapsa sp.]